MFRSSNREGIRSIPDLSVRRRLGDARSGPLVVGSSVSRGGRLVLSCPQRFVLRLSLVVIAVTLHASLAAGAPQFITQWGSPGSGVGQWGNVYGIAVDDSENVYVVDESNHRVEKFTNTGTFLTQWGSQGGALGQF